MITVLILARSYVARLIYRNDRAADVIGLYWHHERGR
jgi:hypothetical protein